MSKIPRPPPAEEFVGQACTYCRQAVENPIGFSLLCRPQEHPLVWRPYHSCCVDEENEAVMSRLLGGR
jgi:hypothetical protein